MSLLLLIIWFTQSVTEIIIEAKNAATISVGTKFKFIPNNGSLNTAIGNKKK